MKHVFRFSIYVSMMLLLAMIFLFLGCFDSRPPAGVTGELVGCITSDNNLYCTTKYADSGVSDAVDVLVGKIDYREFLHSRGTSFGQFHLTTSYKNARDNAIV